MCFICACPSHASPRAAGVLCACPEARHPRDVACVPCITCMPCCVSTGDGRQRDAAVPPRRPQLPQAGGSGRARLALAVGRGTRQAPVGDSPRAPTYQVCGVRGFPRQTQGRGWRRVREGQVSQGQIEGEGRGGGAEESRGAGGEEGAVARAVRVGGWIVFLSDVSFPCGGSAGWWGELYPQYD